MQHPEIGHMERMGENEIMKIYRSRVDAVGLRG